MTKLRFWLGIVAVLACAAPVSGAARPELRTFSAASLAAIKQAHQGTPFILAFWSVTCEPCAEEMMVLAQLHKKYPQVPVLLVAADRPSTRESVQRFLSRYDLGTIATWQFGEEAEERIRYSVDPSWVGELPRTYFFDAKQEVTAISGIVERKWLTDWLEGQRKSRGN